MRGLWRSSGPMLTESQRPRSFRWERDAGKLGTHVATAQFDDSQSFRSVMERLGYEVVEGQLKDSVTARGVHIALRREFVTVRVPARERARA